MYESVGGGAKRVLVVGAENGAREFSPEAVLAHDGLLIVMESDTGRAAELRRRFSSEGMAARATVIGGDPRRMLYKLAGPFDVIVCGPEYVSERPLLEKLLAPDGVIITND